MKLEVSLGKNSYPIIIEKGIFKNSGEIIKSHINRSRCVIITDSNVAPLYLKTLENTLAENGIESSAFVFEAGEQSKNLKTLEKIYSHMSENNINRGDFLIALGGGVVGDTAGFAAATYMRSIPYVQIPTTLLAQVDSSVGGKVAVDLPQGKNLIGNFYHPRLVVIDTDLLATLEEKFFSDGMAEVVKYGCIKDGQLFDNLCAFADKTELMQHIDEIVFTCVNIKRRVVEEDEFDFGERMLLNFGHTIGHAIEKYYNFETITHGMAVAAGMCLITEMSQKTDVTPEYVLPKIKACLKKYGLPVSQDNMKDIIGFISKDKKNFGKTLNIVILEDIGNAKCRKISADTVKEYFYGY